MLSPRQARRTVDLALAASRADQTEVLLYSADSALTRFANSYIHQNVAESNTGLTVRAVLGKKVGIASANPSWEGEPQAVRQTVELALELARHQVDNPDFLSLPQPRPLSPAGGFVEATARLSPQGRARAVGAICRLAREAGLVAAGSYSTGASLLTVANSLGVFAQHRATQAEMTAVVMGGSGSGYAYRLSADAGDIDPEAVAREAVGRARRSQNPIALEPGPYSVVVEPYAVSDILDFLGYLSFGALAVQEGRSFMAGRLGQRVMGENITLWDDGLAPDTLPLPFDFEGVPRGRVDFVVKGVARGVCYDSYTAGREGRESTGHAIPPGETFGPMPAHMFLQPGEAGRDELVASLDRGLLVTRFHYTRTVEPLRVVVTGMTRDGTFLVERGEVVAPVKNLRFTQSYLEALNQAEVGRETQLVRTMFSANRVPALKIARWNFTGATEF